MSCRAFATTLAATHMIIIGQNTKLPYASTASRVKSKTSRQQGRGIERTGLDVGSRERDWMWDRENGPGRGIERTGLDGRRIERTGLVDRENGTGRQIERTGMAVGSRERSWT